MSPLKPCVTHILLLMWLGATLISPGAVSAEVKRGTETQIPGVLLITSEELQEAWQAFADWKSQIGKPTTVLTVAEIKKTYEGTNVREKIRKCVRKHIDGRGIRWVILGGDCLPGGKGLVPGGHRTVHQMERAGIPTDIVYLSKTNWDSDGDGVYGEWKDDRDAISYPDGTIGLGRIPLRTAEDVAAFTEKVIAYESRYPTSGFAKQMTFTCTDQPAYAKVKNSWDGYISKVWDGKADRFFSQQTPWDEEGRPGSHDLSAKNLVGLFNQKHSGKLHIHGHGHLPAWVLEGSTFTKQHVGKLRNDSAYPLITTVSCNTGEYDSAADPSIVERMLRQPKAGSVAIVAPIRTGKPHFAKRSDFRLMILEGKLDGTTLTMTRYWKNGLGEGVTTGEALMRAKAEMSEAASQSPAFHLCICELNLLGDPTLDMRSEVPTVPKLKVTKEIAIGKSSLDVATGIAGANVCLSKAGDIYKVAQTDKDGAASIDIEATSPGQLMVTVFGPNINATQTSVNVK